ncbi:hypothetical protein D3C81_1820870 [compost metagenome]
MISNRQALALVIDKDGLTLEQPQANDHRRGQPVFADQVHPPGSQRNSLNVLEHHSVDRELWNMEPVIEKHFSCQICASFFLRINLQSRELPHKLFR